MTSSMRKKTPRQSSPTYRQALTTRARRFVSTGIVDIATMGKFQEKSRRFKSAFLSISVCFILMGLLLRNSWSLSSSIRFNEQIEAIAVTLESKFNKRSSTSCGPNMTASSIKELCQQCQAASITPNLSCTEQIQTMIEAGSPCPQVQLQISKGAFKGPCSVCDPNDPNICCKQALTTIPSIADPSSSDGKCGSEMSLHQLCLDMINLTSPPGSPSFEKMLLVLQSSKFYSINIQDKIFWDVRNNIAKMFESWGLEHRKVDQNQSEITLTLHVETVVSNPSVCEKITDNCDLIPRVLIQTEQLYAVGKRFIKRLQACHQSPLCMIWDFSDYHLDWWKEHAMSDSLMLLPIMTQKRLGDSNGVLIPLQNRSIDVAFFGLITSRRNPLLDAMDKIPGLELKYSQTRNVGVMRDAYANAKICLIIHSYVPVSAGETHRLSELAPFGCIPVVETWGDKSYLEHYSGCGKVIFSEYDGLVNTTMETLSKINNSSADEMQLSMKKRLDWWDNGIQWDTVLTSIFNGFPRSIQINHDQQKEVNLAIFYNLWLPSGDENEEKRQKIMQDVLAPQIEQLALSFAIQNHTKAPVPLYYAKIGYPISDVWMNDITFPFNLKAVPLKHYEKAYEDVTIDALRGHCIAHPHHDVIYVHPKGSYHPSEKQNQKRKEGTRMASSQDCAKHLESDQCNACGAQLTTTTQPHFSGNFWRAKCAYIRQLQPARDMDELFHHAKSTVPSQMSFETGYQKACYFGFERFASELWIGTHPSFRPCPINHSLDPFNKAFWNKIKDNPVARKREYFLLPGLLWKFSTINGDTIFPPDDSWIWQHFPDGSDFLDAIHSTGSLKGAVIENMKPPPTTLHNDTGAL